MIRDFKKDDIDNITSILKDELIDFDESWFRSRFFSDDTIKLVSHDLNEITGFIMLLPKDISCGIVLYVRNISRRKGIGSALYKRGLASISSLNIRELRTEIRTEKVHSGTFFTERGFKKHFGYKNMIYTGTNVPSNIILKNYNSSMYDSYKRIYEECFYEMRRALNIEPFNCCSSKKDLELKKDEIYVLENDGEVIASVLLDENHIDDLIVSKKHQGKGIGRELLNFSVNKLKNNGHKEINLGVADWNKTALNLYSSFGFKTEISGEFFNMNL